jgi:hypothetical protein
MSFADAFKGLYRRVQIASGVTIMEIVVLYKGGKMFNILLILKYLALIVTLATGFISLIWPKSIKGFTGLEASSPRALTEIRAVMGGTFIGLGVAAFLMPTPEVFKTLGIAYAAIGAIRAVSMFTDHSFERSNIISLISEVALVVMLVL